MAASKRSTRSVKINEKGRRIGESQPRAKLSDHEVRLLREFVAELVADGAGSAETYRRAAAKFELRCR